MKKWILKLLGLDLIIESQKTIINLLNEIALYTKKNAELQEKCNKAYHIK
jgi:hypothetical protein